LVVCNARYADAKTLRNNLTKRLAGVARNSKRVRDWYGNVNCGSAVGIIGTLLREGAMAPLLGGVWNVQRGVWAMRFPRRVRLSLPPPRRTQNRAGAIVRRATTRKQRAYGRGVVASVISALAWYQAAGRIVMGTNKEDGRRWCERAAALMCIALGVRAVVSRVVSVGMKATMATNMGGSCCRPPGIARWRI
jgi:hypothetical protein